MSYKDVLRVFKLERELTDDETATLNTLRRMASSPADVEATVEAFGGSMGKGKPARATTTRNIEHCAACDYTKRAAVHKNENAKGYHVFQSTKPTMTVAEAAKKSARASSIAERLPKPLGQGVKADEYGGFADDTDIQRCTVIRDNGKPCNLLPDHNVHHMQTAMGYHEFEPALRNVTHEAGAGIQSADIGPLP